MSQIEQLLNKLSAIEGFCSGTPASDEAIAALENELNIELPFSYKVFLKRFGWVQMEMSDGVTIAGIHNSDPYNVTASIFHNTSWYREQQSLPNNLLIIQPNEDAPYCFNTAIKNAKGEYQVVCYELHNTNYSEIAANFEKWLEEFVMCTFSDLDDED